MAIRVVVAGLGRRGREWVREVRAEPGYELVAFVDADGETLRDAAERLGLPRERCFSELGAALDASACEAVVVATSADAHTEAREASLGRGLAVLVEKPFTLSLAEAAAIVRLAEDKGASLVVAQNYRYMRAFRTARRVVSEGTLGRVRSVTCQYFRIPHEMAPSLARLPHRVLWGMGVHHLDAMRYVLGREVVGVLNESFTLADDDDAPDGSSMRTLLTFEGGARAVYTATYESSGHEYFEGGQEFYMRFVGTEGTLHVFNRWLFLCGRGGGWPRPVRRGAREISEERVLLRQLAGALTRGEEPESSGRDNLQTMAVVEACVRSSAERRWINPQELLDGNG